MTAQTLAIFLDELEREAHGASVAEEAYRREVAERMRTLEQERAFGFRRFNLMRSITAAVAAAQNEDEALAKGQEVLLAELQISAASEANQETLRRFEPVLRACWSACQPESGEADTAAIAAALREFEAWFGTARSGPFLSLMDREIVELPLVEVC